MKNSPAKIFDNLCIAAKLVNITTHVECLVINPIEGTMVEYPPNHLCNCFCRQLALITGEETNIDHLYERCQEATGDRFHFIYLCPFGLANMIVPVICDNELVVALQVGPILSTSADEILQKYVLSRKNTDSGSLSQLKEYLHTLPQGNIDYIIALAEMISILALERPLASQSTKEDEDFIKESIPETCSTVVNAALEFIANNFTDEEISLSTVAKNVYVHPSHLSRIFSKQTNYHFRSYINKLRVNFARELLIESDMSIGEICREVGFNDQSYFDKVFKQAEGVTPSQYRKRRKTLLLNKPPKLPQL